MSEFMSEFMSGGSYSRLLGYHAVLVLGSEALRLLGDYSMRLLRYYGFWFLGP